MYHLNKNCIYDVSELDEKYAKELFELLVFNDPTWKINQLNNFNYVVRILSEDSYDDWLYYDNSREEWMFDTVEAIDTEFIEDEIGIKLVLFPKLGEEIKFKNKTVVIV